MTKPSAGILLFRRDGRGLEVLLVHPGGPLWARRDEGAWSIPKGELAAGEEPLAAALRELEEETGYAPRGEPIALGTVRQAGGKLVSAWALEGDLDPAGLVSSRFALEWPPKSGQLQSFPEADRAEWFTPAEAQRKILAAQAPLISRLVAMDRELRAAHRPSSEAAMPTTRKSDQPNPDPDQEPNPPGPTGQGREVRKEPAPAANPEAQGLTSRLPKPPPDDGDNERRTKSTRQEKSFKRPD